MARLIGSDTATSCTLLVVNTVTKPMHICTPEDSGACLLDGPSAPPIEVDAEVAVLWCEIAMPNQLHAAHRHLPVLQLCVVFVDAVRTAARRVVDPFVAVLEVPVHWGGRKGAKWCKKSTENGVPIARG
jgi:hypothetical protein